MTRDRKKSVSSRHSEPVRHHHLVLWPMLYVSLVVAAHPVSCEDFWWELAKGRAVTEGSLNPSQVLITGAVASEANWFSGVPFYLIYSYLGLSGLMIFKAAGALAVCRRLLPSTSAMPYLHAAVVTSAMLAAREAWEPSPVFFDAIGLLAIILLAGFWAEKPSLGRVFALSFAMACWANLGPRCIVGVLYAVTIICAAKIDGRAKALSLLIVLASCCLNPAGWNMFYQSGAILWPQITEATAVLRLAGWRPWWEIVGQSEGIAFALLTVLTVVSALVRGARQEIVSLAGAQILAGMSSANLPLASLLLAAMPLVPFSVGLGSSVRSEPSWRPLKTACMGLIGLVFLLAIFPWDRCGNGVGWGLDPRLRADAFSASLESVVFTENAHCVGVREAGLLSWHVRKGIKPFDTPTTAILNGRLREHVLLTSDLSKNWQVPHRRSDGTWGGWWTTLKDRGATAIIVPSENIKLIESLEPTIWKPLSLNSVSIVFGKAGDGGCTRKIIDVLSLRQFVDRGTWVYDPSSEQDTASVDVSAYILGDPASYESLRLAKVFRAMGMHFGAVKILSVFSHSFPPRMREEFAANQLALGYRERVNSGRSSRMRMLAFQLTARTDSLAVTISNVLNWPVSEIDGRQDSVSEAARFYVVGDMDSALRQLTEDSPENLYGKAMLLLELGKVDSAKPVLEDFLTRFSDHRLASSVKIALSAFSP